MTNSIVPAIGLLVSTSLILGACEEPVPEVVEQVRAIKTMTIRELASGQTRKYSGIIEATDSSALSFQVSGNVQSVGVELGERVNQGQLLAVLDPKPYELNVQAAKAELSKARAELSEKQQEFTRQKTLFDKGWVAKAALDQATAGFESAQSQVNFAVSQLNLANRDLGLTKLTAPFDGIIAEREIDPFIEVGAGQKVFEINAEGAIEATFDVPETTIAQITMGMPLKIRFSTGGLCDCEGRITKIGSVAGDANAFPVTAAVLDPPEGVLPGMTAEVTLILQGSAEETAFLLPLAALAPGGTPPDGSIYVFDAESSTVRKTAVKIKGATDNMVAIFEGVSTGDVVATAGVSFLSDGQQVKLLTP